MSEAIDPVLKVFPEGLTDDALLEALHADPLPFEALLDAIQRLTESGDQDRAVGWADLLQEALAGRSDARGMLALLELRCRLQLGSDETLRIACRTGLGKVLTDRRGRLWLKHVGLDREENPQETLKRLRLLMALEPGRICHDPTWGVGMVRTLDDYEERVYIDFEGRPDHPMTYSWAAERLVILPEDHFEVQRRRDPQKMRALACQQPAEVLRTLLASYGPLTVAEIKERLVPSVVPNEGWDDFWSCARTQLQSEGAIEVPKRRNEPVRLCSGSSRFDKGWFEALSRECDPDRLWACLEAWEESGQRVENLSEQERSVLAGRLSFLVRTTLTRHLDLRIAGVLLARRLGFSPSEVEGLEPAWAQLTTPAGFVRAVARARSKDIRTLVQGILNQNSAAGEAMLLAVLGELQNPALDETMEVLLQHGAAAALVNRIRELLCQRPPPPSLVVWTAEHLDFALSQAGIRGYDLALLILEMLDVPGALRSRSRVARALRSFWENVEWLRRLACAMSSEERRSLAKRVAQGTGWNDVQRRAVLGVWLEIDPSLRDIVESQTQPRGLTVRWTSWRSYRERQAQLRHLVEVAIPANSREIAHARSYGDLSENFEYQAAKDHQKILLRRREELEADLRSVRPTDFRGFPTDRVGMGMAVTVQEETGCEKTYHILGEWDRDEGLGIISHRSALAQTLEGHSPGDEVTLDGPAGQQRYRVVRITELPETVRAWIEWEPEPPGRVEQKP